jgi:adenylate cyclase
LSRIELVNEAGFETIRPPADAWAMVGRTPLVDFTLEHASVSRRHAEVRLHDGAIEVRDIGSTNGTFVNTGDALAPNEAARVNEGDLVIFGQVSYRVQVVEAMQVDTTPEVSPTVLHERPLASSDSPTAVPGPPRTELGMAVAPGSRLAVLLEVAKQLSEQQPVEELLEKIVTITTAVMNVHRVAILTIDRDSGELVPQVSRRVGKGDISTSHLPRSILRRVVDEKVALVTKNAADDDRFDGRSVILQNVGAAMCAPLMAQTGDVLGVIYVDRLGFIATYSEDDLDFLTSFASVAGVAIENSRLSGRLREQAVSLSNFQRYFAPGLAEKISNETGAIELGGQRREIAVLFSDIRGFTQISENITPEQLVQILNDYFTEMVDIIFDHGGTLDKFIGDAILANWGAPISHPDDADRALLAAVEMQQELQRMNETRPEGRPLIEMGIGINFGEAFVGNIGSHRRLEYTVIGDVVNVASRLCSIAGPREIAISDPFFEALSEKPSYEAAEPVQLKGKAEKTNVRKVVW